MGRLCERPGCSEDAAVAYGMDPVELVFWLDALAPRHGADARVLCRRHADSMVVPRGWTLDDQREPDLRLFRPPAATAVGRDGRRRTAGRRPAGAEQLALGDDPVFSGTADVGSAGTETVEETVSEIASVVTPPVAEPPVDGPEAAPWMPEFDTDDDLDGLLSARSPLLARAFRGADRTR